MIKAVLNQNTDEKISKTRKKFSCSFEGFLFKAAISALLVLVAVQAAFLDPVFKSTVSNDNKLEGEVLKEEAYFFTPCKMELKLINIDHCPDLEVLINGEKSTAFYDKTVMLELKDGDVVELDAGTVLEEAVVQVSSVSSNISGFLGKTMSVTDGIHLVALVNPVQ
jgi:hypothetical protein